MRSDRSHLCRGGHDQQNFGLGSEAAYVKKFSRTPVSDIDSLIAVPESLIENDGEEHRKQCWCKYVSLLYTRHRPCRCSEHFSCILRVVKIMSVVKKSKSKVVHFHATCSKALYNNQFTPSGMDEYIRVEDTETDCKQLFSPLSAAKAKAAS